MKLSQKKASSKIREILSEMEVAPKEERIAVTWFELDQILESLVGKQDWETGVKIGFIHYMKNNLKGEAIFLPKSVLAFLNGVQL